MVADYDVLADIYDRAGMSDYASLMTPRLLNFAQQNEWMGRRILDLGCGTGASAMWFADRGYNVYGIDRSSDMLAQARAKTQTRSLNVQFVEADAREITDLDPVDLVIALDVFNEFESVRDLEAAFKSIHGVLTKGRMLIFDVHTIEGLAHSGEEGDRTTYKDDKLVVFNHTTFDYERQTHTADFEIFRAAESNLWQRFQANRVQKAFPIQAVATLLRRQKFDVKAVVNTQLQSFDSGRTSVARVIFMVSNL
jgi:ubiquinone/menaquinone biosynthesis C-methylase UbiE